MSIRTLVEINHDFTGRLDGEFVKALTRYLNSGSVACAEDLERYGFRILGLRHHSSNYVLGAEPEGFPPTYRKSDR